MRKKEIWRENGFELEMTWKEDKDGPFIDAVIYWLMPGTHKERIGFMGDFFEPKEFDQEWQKLKDAIEALKQKYLEARKTL